MPVMTIGINNLDWEMAAMKPMLEKLDKENEKKKACIKLQEGRILRLTKKSEMRLARSSIKNS